MSKETVLNIGFDDTDSPKGMCTTFLAYKIVDLLQKQKTEFLDFPRLIRFNPNIPWKTRGNGAVSIRIKTNNPSKVKNQIKNLVLKFSDTQNGANPGLVFFESNSVPSEFVNFSEMALWQLINRNKAKRFAKENNIEFFYQGNGQGLVGAIGAIGYAFEDHTLELLSYRKKLKFGKERKISTESVKIMQEKTSPNTFNSFDTKKGRILITPHGPDPVFYGVRGENVDSLVYATKILKSSEKLDGYMIFKSNQGTGDHLKNELNFETMKPYASGKITGIVSNSPKIAKGGHVFFKILSKNHEFWCAVYKPTGISTIASNLIKGDKIFVGGGVRKASKNFPRIINLEFIEIIHLKKNILTSNPLCKKCNKKMKSK
ncbi:MAG: tRNA(Ile)(2)-agmatinylcytidine synthase, partial [Nitrosopumilus sp.]|nr:tRNA(Ile)(2)-agmatinylcytidine synthase [Nitrosopumilus sp.]